MSLLPSYKDGTKRLSRTIDYSELKFDDHDQVGSGGFGKVFAGYLNGKKIGIKKMTIYENDPNKDKLLKFIEREIQTLKMFSHPNVIQFYGIAEKERSLFLLTELVNGGDLHWYIKNQSIQMTWRLKLLIARDIASAMDYLHNNNVIHRDLKSTNLLVSENWRIKVCDFGLARRMTKSKSKMTICGTDDWMAPEVLVGEEYDKSCDVFSFGVVLIELITRISLSPRIRDENLGIDQAYIKTKIPKDCPNDFLDLVFHCCRIKPSLRPSFAQIEQLLNYLLDHLPDLGEPDLPPLRTFKPPELTLHHISSNGAGGGGGNFSFPRPYVATVMRDQPIINNDNNNNNNNNNNSPDHFSFPRPYVDTTTSSNNNNNNNGNSDHFSFPRPYNPETDNNTNNTDNNNNNKVSTFSFPRPYIPTTTTPTPDDEELQQLKQLVQNNNYSNGWQQQHHIDMNSVVNFNDSELLSFPRPFQSEEDVERNKQHPKQLLLQTDYSFPRPWNPEIDGNNINDNNNNNTNNNTNNSNGNNGNNNNNNHIITDNNSKQSKEDVVVLQSQQPQIYKPKSPTLTRHGKFIVSSTTTTTSKKPTNMSATLTVSIPQPVSIPISIPSDGGEEDKLNSSPPASPGSPKTLQDRIKKLLHHNSRVDFKKGESPTISRRKTIIQQQQQQQPLKNKDDNKKAQSELSISSSPIFNGSQSTNRIESPISPPSSPTKSGNANGNGLISSARDIIKKYEEISSKTTGSTIPPKSSSSSIGGNQSTTTTTPLSTSFPSNNRPTLQERKMAGHLVIGSTKSGIATQQNK